MSPETKDLDLAKRLSAARDAVRRQLGAVIVGQDVAVEEVLIALFSRGHCLLQGVPGLAKTLLVTSAGRSASMRQFSRIQFTPDLLPADLTGTDGARRRTPASSKARYAGPVFANLVLADEINRTPPRTQAALLQAMQEGQVTAGGATHALPQPFFVMATQNPIEQEGTYPLPEAQLDRFFLQSLMEYPSFEEERRIVIETTGGKTPVLEKVLDAAQVLELQDLVRRVPVPDAVVDRAVRLARATRPKDPSAPRA